MFISKIPLAYEMVGKTFSRLEILRAVEMPGKKMVYVEVRCECGKVKLMQPYCIRSGVVVSCGCFAKERSTKHGYSGGKLNKEVRKEYYTWCGIRRRCRSPKDRLYKYYGARGIKVCDRWSYFENFLDDMGKAPGKEYSIERIDVNGDYCPENCCWILNSEQPKNRRVCKFIEIGGEVKTMSEWCRFFNIPRSTVENRIKRDGMSVEEALTKPRKRVGRHNQLNRTGLPIGRSL